MFQLTVSKNSEKQKTSDKAFFLQQKPHFQNSERPEKFPYDSLLEQLAFRLEKQMVTAASS